MKAANLNIAVQMIAMRDGKKRALAYEAGETAAVVTDDNMLSAGYKIAGKSCRTGEGKARRKKRAPDVV